MAVPDATRDDIEDDVVIDFAARVLRIWEFDDGPKAELEDLNGSTVDIKIWEDDADTDVLAEGDWFLFESAKGDIYEGEVTLGSNFGNLTIEPIDPPAERDGSAGASTAAGHAEGGVLAFDVETISTVPGDDFDVANSDHVELLSIGVGYATDGKSPAETDVLVRSGTGVDDEVALLESFCEHVEARDPDQLLVYEGLEFDEAHLLGRAERAGGESLHARVRAIFDEYELRNVERSGTLESTAAVEPTYWDVYTHSLEPPEWRRSHPRWDEDEPIDRPTVENADVPYFGERYLELVDDVDDPRQGGPELRALRELIVHYTRARTEGLFGLHSE